MAPDRETKIRSCFVMRMAESENLGASSDENDHRRGGTDEDSAIKEAESSSKRSYGCVYCKRGFTNAQALGGHMNIHRKDRFNKSPSTSSSNIQIPVNRSGSFIAPDAPVITSSARQSISPFFPSELEKFGNYGPGLETLRSSYFESYVHVDIGSASPSMSFDRDENLGSNLSLRVGSSNYMGSGEETGDQTIKEIDLELRLGRDP